MVADRELVAVVERGRNSIFSRSSPRPIVMLSGFTVDPLVVRTTRVVVFVDSLEGRAVEFEFE
jgi:hypothetical protein